MLARCRTSRALLLVTVGLVSIGVTDTRLRPPDRGGELAPSVVLDLDVVTGFILIGTAAAATDRTVLTQHRHRHPHGGKAPPSW